jgi:hypothetical protein
VWAERIEQAQIDGKEGVSACWVEGDMFDITREIFSEAECLWFQESLSLTARI